MTRRLSRKGLTRPMPVAARTVAEIICREVRRPDHLPLGNPLRFDRVWVDGKLGWSCPMGLHPESRGRDEPFGIPFGKAGEAFADWWDEQKDAEAAVKAVWSRS